MIIGNQSTFAIESTITQAYVEPSLIAIGYFLIIIDHRCYGVRDHEATMLACSFDEVARRLRERGTHTAPFAAAESSQVIADTFCKTCFIGMDANSSLGISMTDFRNTIDSSRLVWAPDGDAAFDDGSFVLQFDVQNLVRLIAFKTVANGNYDVGTLSDKWLDANEYYGVLEKWHTSFKTEWTSLPKNQGSSE